MGHTEKQHQAHNWYDNFKNITYTLLRKIIVNNKFVPPPPPPNTQQDGILNQGVKVSELSKLYRCPFDTTEEVNLAMFQFKINHNIVYTGDKLPK